MGLFYATSRQRLKALTATGGEYHQQGLGKKILGETIRLMIENGMTNLLLFGSPDNPTNAFHEAMGGTKFINSKQEFDGGYYWMDLQKLLERCLKGG